MQLESERILAFLRLERTKQGRYDDKRKPLCFACHCRKARSRKCEVESFAVTPKRFSVDLTRKKSTCVRRTHVQQKTPERADSIRLESTVPTLLTAYRTRLQSSSNLHCSVRTRRLGRCYEVDGRASNKRLLNAQGFHSSSLLLTAQDSINRLTYTVRTRMCSVAATILAPSISL